MGARPSKQSLSDLSAGEDAVPAIEAQDTSLSIALQSEDIEKVNNLLQQGRTLPTQNDLQLALRVCGRNSDTMKTMCAIVGKHIRLTCSLVRHIWAAYPSDKSEVVFVALTDTTDKISLGLPYTILFRKIDEYSQEGVQITYCKESLEKPFTKEESLHLSAALQENSQTLMEKHSNVQMISACSVRSKNFGKIDSAVVPETCIVIYVDVKGLIPIAEDPLPKQINEFAVDIREGGPRLMNDKLPNEYHDHLQMGCKISTDTKSIGTLGAFLECPTTKELCALTCAHVIMQPGDNPSGQELHAVTESFGPDARKIYQPERSELNQIGYVKKVVFRPGGVYETGVDVALIALTNTKRLPQTGGFPKANTEHAGFTARKPMRFTSGEMYTRKDMPDMFECRSELLKFGCASGVTRGAFHLNGTSVRRREIEGNIETYEGTIKKHFGFQLHNQLELLAIGPHEKFAVAGDSGSLVLILHQGNPYDLRAVGILEGGTFNGTYLVTPIWDVLEALEVPHRLKTFPNEEDSDVPLTACFSNLSIQSSGYQSGIESVSRTNSVDRVVLEEKFGSLERMISDEEKKTQERTEELSEKITVTNVKFEEELKEMHKKMNIIKQELHTRIDQVEENNERRHNEATRQHDETMNMLRMLLGNQQH